MISIENKFIEVLVSQCRGASIMLLRVKSQNPLSPDWYPLRSTVDEDDVMGMAFTPLYPWWGVVAESSGLTWGTRKLSFPENPHPQMIHGLGRYRKVKSITVEECRAKAIQYFSDQDYFSAFRAKVVYRLSNNSLIVSVQVENTGEKDAPFCIGQHPYFHDLVDGVGVHVEAPNILEMVDLSQPGADTIGQNVKKKILMPDNTNCSAKVNTATRHRCELSWPGTGHSITVDSTSPFLHLWRNASRGLCAAEVVTGVPFYPELAMTPGMTLLAPGEKLGVSAVYTFFRQ